MTGSFDAAYYADLESRVKGLVRSVEDLFPSHQIAQLLELAEHNEPGVAVETLSEMLVERNAPVARSLLDELHSLAERCASTQMFQSGCARSAGRTERQFDLSACSCSSRLRSPAWPGKRSWTLDAGGNPTKAKTTRGTMDVYDVYEYDTRNRLTVACYDVGSGASKSGVACRTLSDRPGDRGGLPHAPPGERATTS